MELLGGRSIVSFSTHLRLRGSEWELDQCDEDDSEPEKPGFRERWRLGRHQISKERLAKKRHRLPRDSIKPSQGPNGPKENSVLPLSGLPPLLRRRPLVRRITVGGKPEIVCFRQTGFIARRVVERWLNRPAKIFADQLSPRLDGRESLRRTKIAKPFDAGCNMPDLICRYPFENAR
jgi:hypothetical protein